MNEKNRRRNFGAHLTPENIFLKFIFPFIKDFLNEYLWVDLFCGEGNLILPILNFIPLKERESFFLNHIFLCDIQTEMIEKARLKAIQYGISEENAKKNIIQQDSFLTSKIKSNYPIFHITNPPYLYKGYIAKYKKQYLFYFNGDNKNCQDLYQIALKNDLKNNVKKMIYIVPLNFIFGDAGSKKIRKEIFDSFYIQRAFFFEDKIFEHTGTNVGIFFFERKNNVCAENLKFLSKKIKNGVEIEKEYVLKPENNYCAGNNFENFIKKYKSKIPIKVFFYLTEELVLQENGTEEIKVINANKFSKKIKNYEKQTIKVTNQLKEKILSNMLFVKPLDTGTEEGRVGLYEIKKEFDVDGLLTLKPYRTHPIQVFFITPLSYEEQIYLKKYFNILLEYFREVDDSDFLTTFQYSKAKYTRKFLGLKKVKELIQTFPWLELKEDEKEKLKNAIDANDAKKILNFLTKVAEGQLPND